MLHNGKLLLAGRFFALNLDTKIRLFSKGNFNRSDYLGLRVIACWQSGLFEEIFQIIRCNKYFLIHIRLEFEQVNFLTLACRFV